MFYMTQNNTPLKLLSHVSLPLEESFSFLNQKIKKLKIKNVSCLLILLDHIQFVSALFNSVS